MSLTNVALGKIEMVSIDVSNIDMTKAIQLLKKNEKVQMVGSCIFSFFCYWW